MWEEISRKELPRSQIFVIFWSERYAKAKGCVRELIQARDLVASNNLRPVVLRLDDYPIIWNSTVSPDLKAAFDALAAMLHYRTSSTRTSADKAADLVLRVSEPILRSDHPRMARDDSQNALRKMVRRDRFTYYPAVWVSGFNGVGRESLIRDFYRAFSPNGRGVVVDVDEASLPRQIRLRMESEALGAGSDRLNELNAAAVGDEIAAIADIIDQVNSVGNFIIFRHNRIVEESVELPEWIDDVVVRLATNTRPRLFIISQLPLSIERRGRCRDKLIAHRIPTIDEHDLEDFAPQLIGYFDERPDRWSNEAIDDIVRASAGNIGFLVSLVRAAASVEDFEGIDALIAADQTTLVASITAYVYWAFAQLREYDDEQRALLFLDNISPCDIGDLEHAIEPRRPMLRVLGKLLELGLVEREGDSLYRLTPLLARRLNRELIRPDLLDWLSSALLKFTQQPFDVDAGEHEFLRIESRISASILSEVDELPKGVVEFVSAAHWFRAGVKLYHARRREPAYRVLKKAYRKKTEFLTASRVELTRYFALSAIQNRKFGEAEECIASLDKVFSTKDMAECLRAEIHEHKGEYFDAIEHYERAIKLNDGKNSRLERTYRPIIKCILATNKPDFDRANRYAMEWLALRETIFSLSASARVYLNWKYRGFASGREVPENIDALYRDALTALKRAPGVGSAHFEIKAEEAEFSGKFDDALTYMEEAIAADPRFELRGERWRLMSRTGSKDLARRVITELSEARHNPEFSANWAPFLPMLAESYARALKVTGRPFGELNQFCPELTGEEVANIITRAKRVARPKS